MTDVPVIYLGIILATFYYSFIAWIIKQAYHLGEVWKVWFVGVMLFLTLAPLLVWAMITNIVNFV